MSHDPVIKKNAPVDSDLDPLKNKKNLSSIDISGFFYFLFQVGASNLYPWSHPDWCQEYELVTV